MKSLYLFSVSTVSFFSSVELEEEDELLELSEEVFGGSLFLVSSACDPPDFSSFSLESIIMVHGPELTKETFIKAPNSPAVLKITIKTYKK